MTMKIRMMNGYCPRSSTTRRMTMTMVQQGSSRQRIGRGILVRNQPNLIRCFNTGGGGSLKSPNRNLMDDRQFFPSSTFSPQREWHSMATTVPDFFSSSCGRPGFHHAVSFHQRRYHSAKATTTSSDSTTTGGGGGGSKQKTASTESKKKAKKKKKDGSGTAPAGTSQLNKSAALEVAATEGRTAVALVRDTLPWKVAAAAATTPTTTTKDDASSSSSSRAALLSSKSSAASSSTANNNDPTVVNRRLRSVLQASEQLLSATKATSILADQIVDIRKQQQQSSPSLSSTPSSSTSSSNQNWTTASKTCLQELHRAFLSLTQSLLDCIDLANTTTNGSSKTNNRLSSSQRPLTDKQGHDDSHNDDDNDLYQYYRYQRSHLLQLTMKLSYRAHQLQLPFHWPLYQRLALTLARQQQEQPQQEEQPHGQDQSKTLWTSEGGSKTTSSTISGRKATTSSKRKTTTTATATITTTALRSRAEWIWNIHKWSREVWGHHDDSSNHAAARATTETIQQKDLEWFRPSLVALANGQQWSDLAYLLRGLLLSSSSFQTMSAGAAVFGKDDGTGGSGGRASRRKHSASSSSKVSSSRLFVPTTPPPESCVYLDEDLIRDILRAMQRRGIFTGFWKSLRRLSPAEEDVLEILLLMEPSIWQVFSYHHSQSNDNNDYNDDDARTDNRHDSRPSTATTDARSVDRQPLPTERASLKDAIEVLLQTTSLRGFSNTEHMDDDEFDNYNEESLVQTLSDLEDLLSDETKDIPEDTDEENGSPLPDVSALAALFSDPTWRDHSRSDRPSGRTNRRFKGRHGRNVGARPVVPRDLEVRTKRFGDYQVLEITGLNKNNATQMSNVRNMRDLYSVGSADRAWEYLSDESDDVYEGANRMDDATVIYTRTADYQDDIPDLCHQLYEHNGRQQLRYRPNMEQEVLRQFYHSNEEEFSDDDEEEDDEEF